MGEPLARFATVADLPGMLGVIDAAFTGWPPYAPGVSPADHLRWKLGPEGEAAIGDQIVVEVDGRLAAVRLAWNAACQIGDRRCHWENSADMAVHPEFQGLGISRLLNAARLDRLIENGYLSFGAVSPNPQVRHMDQIAWEVRPLTVWTRTSSARAFAATHYRSGGLGQLARAVRAVATRRRVRGIAERELPGGAIRELQQFDAATDAVWEAARTDFDIVTERTAEYLNWRHLDPRGGAAVALQAVSSDRVRGYAVFKADGEVVRVTDLLVESGHTAVAAALLSAGAERFEAHGYRQLVCWLPAAHPYDAALRGAGFVETSSDRFIFATRAEQGLRPPAMQALLDGAGTRFHVTMSDFDFV